MHKVTMRGEKNPTPTPLFQSLCCANQLLAKASYVAYSHYSGIDCQLTQVSIYLKMSNNCFNPAQLNCNAL